MTSPSYLHVRSDKPNVVATVQISNDLLVDINSQGHVLGVERISGAVDFESLWLVLRDDRVVVSP